MKTTIFYFSGTGNSLYVARKLAEALGNSSVLSIAGYSSAEQIGGENERIGFVFPSYYGNLPRIVRRFIESLNIHPDTWVFGISTMAISFGKGSISALQKCLAEKGITLNYGDGVTMPRNYIIEYNPYAIQKAHKCNEKADKRIKVTANEIRAKKDSVRKGFLTTNTLYKNIESLDAAFFADDNCSGCGQCEKICPVKNIKLVNKRPEWQHHCEHCVTCIHWCPKEAIQYGSKTKKRRRYRNPKIKLSDLTGMQKNEP
ncbi:MAG: EFR1 family ferrodoxin [Oscillospiraceae bacterium]|nr:EFR1 family ferrodoxin [Oscillospiraceae bacterium]